MEISGGGDVMTKSFQLAATSITVQPLAFTMPTAFAQQSFPTPEQAGRSAKRMNLFDPDPTRKKMGFDTLAKQ
jgi:hypothetical protein